MNKLLPIIGSIFICLVLGSVYVLSLYVLVPEKIKKLSRDDPEHIKSRMRAVCVGVVIDVAVACYILYGMGFDYRTVFVLLFGLNSDRLLSICLRVTVLMALFYLGPLVTFMTYTTTLVGHDIDNDGNLSIKDKPESLLTILGELGSSYKNRFDPIMLFRNLIFAPITEELVFRSIMFSILFIANCSPGDDRRHEHHALVFASKECSWQTVRVILCVCPFMFSIAHLHHFFDKLRQGYAVSAAASEVLVQATYTGIFGFIAVVLFARTGNIIAPIVSHMICNFVGLPDLGFMVRPRVASDISTSSMHYRSVLPEYSFMYSYRYLHLFLHAFGLMLFAYCLFPLTSDLANSSIYWKHLFVFHH